MISLLESNLCYKNLKHELSEIFPEISKYVLSSIYTETLRGQIREREDVKYDFKVRQKWKRLRSQSVKLVKHYKSYIIKLPNLLENICSEELCPENIKNNTCQVDKALGLLLREKAINLVGNHSLVFIVLWDKVGRFRTLEKTLLIEELEKYTDIELFYLEEILTDLTSSGLVVQLGDEYGIASELRL